MEFASLPPFSANRHQMCARAQIAIKATDPEGRQAFENQPLNTIMIREASKLDFAILQTPCLQGFA
jgi:hypothetical protein